MTVGEQREPHIFSWGVPSTVTRFQETFFRKDVLAEERVNSSRLVRGTLGLMIR